MMYVVIVTRIVKKNTGATDKFAPRTANVQSQHAHGPFLSLKTAQRAVIHALQSHTCLDALIWSEAQIRDQHAKGCQNRWEFQAVLDSAVRALDAAHAE